MKHKIANIVSWLAIISAVFLVVVYTYWATFPYKPIVINKEPITVLTRVVGKNKPLIYELDYCKYMDLPAEVQKSYENDIIFPASIQTATNLKGCKVNTVSQIVPYELPTGRYKLKIAFLYKVNPIRTVTVVAYTDYFQVVERD